ncbi:MAG TPA: response regulator [Lacunisphaera sp.]
MSSVVISRPTVLLVEDETALASTLCESLQDQYEIEVAGNVAEARALFSTRKFDVILSDHMLPGKQQGLDFLIEALQQKPETKRILMTGYLNPELLSRGASLAQLSACLIKPVEIMRLRKELDEAIGRR